MAKEYKSYDDIEARINAFLDKALEPKDESEAKHFTPLAPELLRLQFSIRDMLNHDISFANVHVQ